MIKGSCNRLPFLFWIVSKNHSSEKSSIYAASDSTDSFLESKKIKKIIYQSPL